MKNVILELKTLIDFTSLETNADWSTVKQTFTSKFKLLIHTIYIKSSMFTIVLLFVFRIKRFNDGGYVVSHHEFADINL
jgi:hypothetical protein